jgi:hypothetical protein
MIIRIDKGFMVELQKRGYDLDYRNLAEVYQTFRQRLGARAQDMTSSEGEEEASERHKARPF